MSMAKPLPLLFLDGGLSSLLEEEVGALHPKLWSSALLLTEEGCEAVISSHEAFVRAGADMIQTVSYQATVPGFVEHGQVSSTEALNLVQKSVALAQEGIRRAGCCSTHAFKCAQEPATAKQREDAESTQVEARTIQVVGSIGCYGAFLANGAEYRGDYQLSTSEFRTFYVDKIRALASAGCDVLAFETIPCLEEALAIVDIMATLHMAIPYWISFQCSTSTQLANGHDLRHAVAAVLNATTQAGHVKRLSSQLCTCTCQVAPCPTPTKTSTTPSISSPSSTHVAPRAHAYLTSCQLAAQEGATILGGCCRIFPDTLQDMIQANTQRN
eukprot:m.74293 g.74293  ORF g.74293 m.74293 type:complete len:328 (+) comp12392_c0_seq1:353-1336(+)